MNPHRRTEQGLYDYVSGTMPPDERKAMDAHFSRCPACAEQLEKMRWMVETVPTPTDAPSSARPQEYWRSFPFRVEELIQQRFSRRQFAIAHRIRDHVESFFVVHRGAVTLAGLGTVLAAIAILMRPSVPVPTVLQERPSGHQTSVIAQISSGDSAVGEGSPHALAPGGSATPAFRPMATGGRIADYFSRSKVLLVGIVNMDNGLTGSMHSEQRESRHLVREARYLKQRPDINPKTRRLIEDLERILIELANSAERGDSTAIELVRDGIHQENLLFKIRMSEMSYSAPNSPGSTSQRKESSL